MKFSANLGFLWKDRPLADAIEAAAEAGFDAVECHWPYDTPVSDVTAALAETGLPMLGINTRRGDVTKGEFGVCAVPGREADARSAINEAVNYASAIGARMIHVMAGNAQGDAARDVFLHNLAFAANLAARNDLTVLIEPLNRHDAPDYFLRDTAQAVEILSEINARNVKLMFDCYHVQRTEGDVTTRLTELLEHIGHIQIAGVPERGAPDRGELNYAHMLRHLAKLGWSKPIGAEYKPAGDTVADLGWMAQLRDP